MPQDRTLSPTKYRSRGMSRPFDWPSCRPSQTFSPEHSPSSVSCRRVGNFLFIVSTGQVIEWSKVCHIDLCTCFNVFVLQEVVEYVDGRLAGEEHLEYELDRAAIDGHGRARRICRFYLRDQHLQPHMDHIQRRPTGQEGWLRRRDLVHFKLENHLISWDTWRTKTCFNRRNFIFVTANMWRMRPGSTATVDIYITIQTFFAAY